MVGQGSGEDRVEDRGVGQGCGTGEWDRGVVGQGRCEDRMEDRGVKNVGNDKIVEESSGTFDLCSSGGTFRSTWAKGIQAELAKAAEAVRVLKGTRREDEREEEKKEEEKTAEEEKEKGMMVQIGEDRGKTGAQIHQKHGRKEFVESQPLWTSQ